MTFIAEHWPWFLGALAVVCSIAFGVWWYYDHRVYSGVVQDKYFTAAHTTTTMVGIYNGTSTTYIPQTTHHEAKALPVSSGQYPVGSNPPPWTNRALGWALRPANLQGCGGAPGCFSSNPEGQ
jgi:hypothetical protein